MKTISLRKKVSAVAVASLGFGLLSVVPANATTEIGSAGQGGGVTAITATRYTATPVTGTAVDVQFGASVAALTANAGNNGDKITFKAALTAIPTGGSVAVTSVLAANASPTGTATPFVVSGGSMTLAANASSPVFTATAAAGGADAYGAQTLSFLGAFRFTPTRTGVHTMTVWNDFDLDDVLDATEVFQTVSITVAAAAGYSNSLSTAFIVYGNGTTADATTSAAQNSVSAAKATANRAAINVVINDSTGTTFTSGASLAAEISGPGYLKWANQAVTATQCDAEATYGSNVGRSLAARAVDGQSALYVCADGTAGVATVTLRVTDQDLAVQTLATRTVTFFGAVTKIEATGVLTIARSGGATLGVDTANRTAGVTPSVIVRATDSAGIGVSGLSFTAVSSAPAIMQSTISCNEDIRTTANVASSGGNGFYNCSVTSASGAASGNTAILTVRTVNPADTATFLTSPVTFTIGGTVATETLSFDKTSYAPGEAMVITRTARDSAGNPVFDGATSPAVTFSKAVGGTAPGTGTYVKGVSASSTSAATATVFAPVVPGSFIASATSGATGSPTITATSSVTDANSAVLTQIGALNARVVALNALIAKIMKRLNIR